MPGMTAFSQLLQADLKGKVVPTDLPFRIPLYIDSVILFDSEMHSKIQNTKTSGVLADFGRGSFEQI